MAESTRFSVFVRIVSVLVLAAVPCGARASSAVYIYADVYQNYDSSGIPASLNRRAADNRSGPTFAAEAGSIGSAGPSAATTAGATAVATEGRLSVRAGGGATVMTGHYDSEGNAYMPSQGAWGNAETTASWNDQVTISDPSRVGQRGSFSATLLLTGSVASYSSPFANISTPSGYLYVDTSGYARLTVGGNGLNWTTQPWDDACAAVGWSGWLACAHSAGYDPTGANTYNAGAVKALPVVVDFTFGSPFALGYTLYANAGGTASTAYYKMAASGAGGGDADMSHTLLWGGISTVLDASGAAVSSYDLASVSGFDYRLAAAVPEPKIWALLLAGLAVVGRLARRSDPRRA